MMSQPEMRIVAALLAAAKPGKLGKAKPTRASKAAALRTSGPRSAVRHTDEELDEHGRPRWLTPPDPYAKDAKARLRNAADRDNPDELDEHGRPRWLTPPDPWAKEVQR